jgi:hypothetical protein
MSVFKLTKKEIVVKIKIIIITLNSEIVIAIETFLGIEVLLYTV